MAANVLSLATVVVNAVSLGRRVEAAEAAAHLLSVDPTFRIGHVDYVFPVRSADSRTRIARALRESGLPESNFTPLYCNGAGIRRPRVTGVARENGRLTSIVFVTARPDA